ncbi:hypothetical protein BH11PLA1_BH11PLA1_05290 [soil metagenome]
MKSRSVIVVSGFGANHRVVRTDRMTLSAAGHTQPVRMTFTEFAP